MIFFWLIFKNLIVRYFRVRTRYFSTTNAKAGLDSEISYFLLLLPPGRHRPISRTRGSITQADANLKSFKFARIVFIIILSITD